MLKSHKPCLKINNYKHNKSFLKIANKKCRSGEEVYFSQKENIKYIHISIKKNYSNIVINNNHNNNAECKFLFWEI